MKILKEENNKLYSLKTKKIELSELSNLNNKTIKQIIDILQKSSAYPKEIAKQIGIHEQNIYYHIKKLEKAKIIEIEKQENINGTIANYYKITDSIYIQFKEFKQTNKIEEKKSKFLSPFIKQGKINCIIVVGSPDPHGPLKARSRDGYFGIDFALFLGSFLSESPTPTVLLDTEITDEQIKNNNLIVIGGPIVNRVSTMVNQHLPIYFDEEKKGIYSKITKKIYHNDEIGVINKIENPYNKDKQILSIMGMRHAGIKSAIISFLDNFRELEKENPYDKQYNSRVVEGIDLNSDGIVDSVEFLE